MLLTFLAATLALRQTTATNYSNVYKWSNPTATHELELRMVQLKNSPKYRITLNFLQNDRLLWTQNQETDDGPLLTTPRATPSIATGDLRLLQINYTAPNWAETAFYLSTFNATQPLVFKYRDKPENVVSLLYDKKGHVGQIQTYDRWVGGVSKPVRKHGVIFDRREQITTYHLDQSGFKAVQTITRLVPAQGGGSGERNFIVLKK